MILSEHTRRWAEVRLYQFCTGIYNYRNKTVDIYEVANTIALLGNADPNIIKKIINSMLNDTYYQATRRETILLAHLHSRKTSEIADYMEVSKQAINKYIRANLETFTPIPRCEIKEDQEIIKFLNALDSIKGIGI